MTDFLNKIINIAKSAQSDRIINQAAKEKRNRLLPSFTTYQGIDPIDGTDKVMINGETNSGFNLISNASLSIGERVFLRPNQSGGLQRVDARNRSLAAPATPLAPPSPSQYMAVSFQDIVISIQLDNASAYIDAFDPDVDFQFTNFNLILIDPVAFPWLVAYDNGANGTEYSGVFLSSFSSGNPTISLNLSASDPYPTWGVQINCQDGYSITPLASVIRIEGILIIPGQVYELQAQQSFNGGAYVDASTLYSSVATNEVEAVVLEYGRVDFTGLSMVETYFGDLSEPCNVIGSTTLEWYWRWRLQGEDWFRL